MNWRAIGLDAYHAAQAIRKYPRSCISRAYYAAYSIATQILADTKGVNFPRGREGSSHAILPELIESHLSPKVDRGDVKKIKQALNRLYLARLEADYNPKQSITELNAIKALIDAATVLRILYAF